MKTVLIVEDEPLHLEKIKTSFKGYENKYRLKTTNFLKTAVHIIKESQPDIVLTDNRLPDGEGREIIKNTQGICPLILMTAYGDEQLAVNAMKEGALDYIVKLPETIADLPHTVDRSLREWKLLEEKEILKKKLEKREEKYKKLVENAVAGIGITDLNENLVFINETFANMLGYSREEITGKNLSSFSSSKDYDTFLNQTKSRFSNQNSVYETTLLKKDGSPVHIMVHGSPYYNDKNELTGTIGVIIDITDRKKAEQEIKRAELFNREILNNAGEGIAVYDKNLCFQLWNPFMEKITGKKAEELIGKCALDEFPHLKEQELNKVMSQALKGKQIRTHDIPFRVPNTGMSGWVSTLYSPHYDDKGNIIGIIATINDVTKHKTAEEKLKELNKTQNRLLSIIGHDLKNSISEILGFSELLINSETSFNKEKQAEFQKYIYNSTKEAYSLLENLLEWSRLQKTIDRFNPQNFPIRQVIDDAVNIYKTKAQKNKIEVACNIPESFSVFGDEKMIHTIFRNLLYNALKFTPEGGKINISASSTDGKTVLNISDNGNGISIKQQNELFNPDYLFSKKGIFGEKGTGLGLQLCKDLIEKHGEKIWVESEPGKGATFSFTLPQSGIEK